MAYGLLGIMTNRLPPSADRNIWISMCRLAPFFGLRAFLFQPEHADFAAGTVTGMQYDHTTASFAHRQFPLPDLVYNRHFSAYPHALPLGRQTICLFKRRGAIVLNENLPGKWFVYQSLKKHPEIAPYLPPTVLYRNGSELLRFIRKYHGVFLKPDAGCQGKNTVKIDRLTGRWNGYRLTGRDARNRTIRRLCMTETAVQTWIETFFGHRRFLVQPCLNLTNAEHRVYDVRAFVQKNGRGQWTFIGMGARIGGDGSATSNLYGGGEAAHAADVLGRMFDAGQTRRLLSEIKRLSRRIPPLLEADFGRLCELGIDFGIDRGGKLWVLEVNSKPGRAIFRKLGLHRKHMQIVANPLRYARFLWLGRHPQLAGSVQTGAL